nr:MAG TPA: hypothetical protein [Caudoviricetes sp.]
MAPHFLVENRKSSVFLGGAPRRPPCLCATPAAPLAQPQVEVPPRPGYRPAP